MRVLSEFANTRIGRIGIEVFGDWGAWRIGSLSPFITTPAGIIAPSAPHMYPKPYKLETQNPKPNALNPKLETCNSGKKETTTLCRV